MIGLAGCCGDVGYLCRPENASFDCRFENDGAGAICIFDGKFGTFCAFPDPECASKFRWSHSSYKASCECVDSELLAASGKGQG